MEREPTHYSRLLVLVGLIPLLIADLAVGLPDGAFVGGGAIVMAVAAGVHLYGGESRAAAGWLLFGAALGLVVVTDPIADTLSLLAFVFLLVSGLVLLASQRVIEAPTDDGST